MIAKTEAANSQLVALLREALRGAIADLEQTLHWRGEGWECSEAELLGDYREALRQADLWGA